MPLTIEELKEKFQFQRGNDGTCYLLEPIELICLSDGVSGKFTYSSGKAGGPVQMFESRQVVLADMFNDQDAWQRPNQIHLRVGYWWPIEHFELKT